jgi:hypothetical protein
LIKVLLNFSDQSIWADEDLAIQNLIDSELAAYRYLCSNKVLFYLRFYRPEYREMFFRIIRENHHYHALFKEEYSRME